MPGRRSRSGTLATSAFVATHFGAAAAAIGWMVAEWIRKASRARWAASPARSPGWWPLRRRRLRAADVALADRIARRAVLLHHGRMVKQRFGYDDSLDAFGVHGAGGTLGALLTGVFATSAINPIFKDAAGNTLPVGMVDGHWGQVGNQIVGILIAIVLSVVGTFVLLKLVDL